jgi:hypothetical protein
MPVAAAFLLFDSFPPFDMYGDNVSARDEKARLDNLVFYLRQEQDRVVYVFAYGGRRSCPGEAQKRLNRVTRHLVKTRGIAADRVFARDGGYRENLMIELFLRQRDSEIGPPSATPNVEPGEVEFRRNCKPSYRRRRR